MISEQTQNALKLLGQISDVTRWRFRLLRGILLALFPHIIAFYLVIDGMKFLSTPVLSVNAPLLTLADFFLKSAVLNGFLAFLAFLSIRVTYTAGTVMYRVIFEFAYLLYPIKFRLGPVQLFFSVIGSLAGAFVSIKIGLPAVLSYASYYNLSLYNLTSIIPPAILLTLPLAGAITFAFCAAFSPKLRTSLKKITNDFIAFSTSSLNIVLGVFLGYFALDAGIIGILSTIFVVFSYRIALTLYNLSFNEWFIQKNQNLSYYYRDKAISLGSILNLRADDALVEEFLPYYTGIMAMCISPEFASSVFLDYGNPAKFEENLNLLAGTDYFKDFIKLGANPAECLLRTKEEKTAENLLGYFDNKIETEEKKQALSSAVALKSYTLKWQAAKVLAKQENVNTTGIPPELITFIEQVKEAIKPSPAVG